MTTEWTPTAASLPPLEDQAGLWRQSHMVAVRWAGRDGDQWCAARLYEWPDLDGDGTRLQWLAFGPDGYEVEGVTAWAEVTL